MDIPLIITATEAWGGWLLGLIIPSIIDYSAYLILNPQEYRYFIETQFTCIIIYITLISALTLYTNDINIFMSWWFIAGEWHSKSIVLGWSYSDKTIIKYYISGWLKQQKLLPTLEEYNNLEAAFYKTSSNKYSKFNYDLFLTNKNNSDKQIAINFSNKENDINNKNAIDIEFFENNIIQKQYSDIDIIVALTDLKSLNINYYSLITFGVLFLFLNISIRVSLINFIYDKLDNSFIFIKKIAYHIINWYKNCNIAQIMFFFYIIKIYIIIFISGFITLIFNETEINFQQKKNWDVDEEVLLFINLDNDINILWINQWYFFLIIYFCQKLCNYFLINICFILFLSVTYKLINFYDIYRTLVLKFKVLKTNILYKWYKHIDLVF